MLRIYMFIYVFLQHIEVANRTKLQLLRQEFDMREFYFFFFCLSTWVSAVSETDRKNSCFTPTDAHANYLDKAHCRDGVLFLTAAAQTITLSLTTLHFSQKRAVLDPASPRQL